MSRTTIKVVGFDPSTAHWGTAFGSVDIETGELTITGLKLVETESEKSKGVTKQSDDLRRARVVYEGMVESVKGMTVVFSEIPFMNPGSYASANFNSGLVTGVLASCDVPVIQVSPREVKMASVGIATATKEEMIEWAVARHPEAPWLMRTLKGKQVYKKSNEHLADAVAAIHAGLKTDQFRQLMNLMRHAKMKPLMGAST
jgi:Holliday junction resolvasome RuvABC endonuclease subunit